MEDAVDGLVVQTIATRHIATRDMETVRGCHKNDPRLVTVILRTAHVPMELTTIPLVMIITVEGEEGVYGMVGGERE